jgi:4-hydroxy-tetrahydrodipicolinate reductase
MKIALLGYGKMGHEIEKAILEHGHSIGLIIDNERDWAEKANELKKCDAAIEFSIPAITFENMRRCFESNIPVVVGTTGWYGRFDEITELCRLNNGTLFYASNFSIGVNIFSEINRKLASMLETYPMYTPSMTEIHHLQKLDAPSGTAITLANDIIKYNSRYNTFTMDDPKAGEIPVNAIREGNVTGTHTIAWSSEIDKITITHEAMNRRGFALGAVMAASWIQGRKGIFTMQDMLEL